MKEKNDFTKNVVMVFAIIGVMFVAVFLMLPLVAYKVIPMTGTVGLPSTGTSMLPEISPGSLIFIDTSVKDLKVNDIGCYTMDRQVAKEVQMIALGDDETKDMLICHRVVEVNEGYYTFKGDNNLVNDPWEVSQEQIFGSYKFHTPVVGAVVIGEYFITNVLDGAYVSL